MNFAGTYSLGAVNLLLLLDELGLLVVVGRGAEAGDEGDGEEDGDTLDPGSATVLGVGKGHFCDERKKGAGNEEAEHEVLQLLAKQLIERGALLHLAGVRAKLGVTVLFGLHLDSLGRGGLEVAEDLGDAAKLLDAIEVIDVDARLVRGDDGGKLLLRHSILVLVLLLRSRRVVL